MSDKTVYSRLVSAVPSIDQDSAQAQAAAESCNVPLPMADPRHARYNANWSGGFCFNQVDAAKQAIAQGDTGNARRIATEYLTKIATIGTAENTYFCGAAKLTQDSVEFVRYLMQNGMSDLIANVASDVYTDSRAKSVSHGIYLHSMLTTITDSVSGSPKQTAEIRKVGYELVSMYRTGSHFLEWVATHMEISQVVAGSKGTGNGFRNACNAWFKKHSAQNLEYQSEKYASRKGVAMRDVLAMSHLKPTSRVRNKSGRSGASTVRDYMEPASQFVLARIVNGLDSALTELDEIAGRAKDDADGHASMHLALECVAYAVATRIVKDQTTDHLTVVSMINAFGLTWEMINNSHFASNAVLMTLVSRESMSSADIHSAKVGLLRTTCADHANIRKFYQSYENPDILNNDQADQPDQPAEAIDLTAAIEAEIESMTKAKDGKTEMNYADVVRTVVPADQVCPARHITMPFTAFLRWLGRTSKLLDRSVNPNAPEFQQMMVAHLTNPVVLRKSRVHPFTILTALATYQSGKGDKGSLTWDVNTHIVAALNRAMRVSFENVEPHGKIAAHLIDGSGSMRGFWSGSAGTSIPNVSPADLCAFMVAVSMEAEGISDHPERFYAGVFQGWGNSHYGANSDEFKDITAKLTSTSSFDDCRKVMAAIDGGRTNMSMAFEYYQDMLEKSLVKVKSGDAQYASIMSFMQLPGFVELFQLWTDNEINSGKPVTIALENYRAVQRRAIKMLPCTLDGIKHTVDDLYAFHCAKLVVVCTEATKFVVGDPMDMSILTVSGFDASGPQMITDFVKGWDTRTSYVDSE